MGEIVGGAIVMAVFIAFVIWKGTNKSKDASSYKSINEQRYWDEKNAQETQIVSADDDNDDRGD